MKQKSGIGVTKHALVRRIGRALFRKDQRLYYVVSTQEKDFREGGYVVINVKTGKTIDAGPVNLEKLARELEVLEPFEFLSK